MIRVILVSLLFLLFNNESVFAKQKKDTHPACQLVVVVCPGEE